MSWDPAKRTIEGFTLTDGNLNRQSQVQVSTLKISANKLEELRSNYGPVHTFTCSCELTMKGGAIVEISATQTITILDNPSKITMLKFISFLHRLCSLFFQYLRIWAYIIIQFTKSLLQWLVGGHFLLCIKIWPLSHGCFHLKRIGRFFSFLTVSNFEIRFIFEFNRCILSEIPTIGYFRKKLLGNQRFLIVIGIIENRITLKALALQWFRILDLLDRMAIIGLERWT